MATENTPNPADNNNVENGFAARVKAFGRKYWKHTAIGAGIAIAAGTVIYVLHNDDNEDCDSCMDETEIADLLASPEFEALATAAETAN